MTPAYEEAALRLADLRARGAASFDPEGFRLAERLANAAVLERAALRMGALERDLEEAKTQIEAAVTRLSARGLEPDADTALALERGELRAAYRLLLRLEHRAGAAESSTVRWARKLASRARTRGARLPDDLAYRVERLTLTSSAGGPTALSREQASALAHALSRAMFVDSLASSRATLAIARATDNVPEDCGPYNAQVIAARVLAELAALSPSYARAFVAGLDDLASLEALPMKAPPKSSGRRRH